MMLFVPETVGRTVATWQSMLTDVEWAVERRGMFRTIVRIVGVVDGATLELTPLTGGELSAELRARSDGELREAMAAFRVTGSGSATRLAQAVNGWLRDTDPSPVLRGLALCALVARLRAEDDEYDGREQEPGRLLAWLERHGAQIALSEDEREWLLAPVDALPEEARDASLSERFVSHAFALGLVPTPEFGDLPGLMSRFGFLSDKLPAGLERRGIRPGRDEYLA